MTSIVHLDRGEVVGRVGDAVAVGGGFVPPAEANCTSCTKSSRVFAPSREVRLLWTAYLSQRRLRCGR
jgi:hypothetical protein